MFAPFEFPALIVSFTTLMLAGAMTGLYFAFSISVMPAFNEIPAPAAIAGMRSINRRIQNRWFFVAFFGTPFAGLAAGALLTMIERNLPGYLMFASGAVYLLGSLMPTLIVNVPLNMRLDRAALPETESEAASLWVGYSERWTHWNTIRGVASAISLALSALALLLWG